MREEEASPSPSEGGEQAIEENEILSVQIKIYSQ